MSNGIGINWLPEPEEKDYMSAESYLSLLYDSLKVKGIGAKLRKKKMFKFQSKDIFRASGLSLLGANNSHVEKDRIKIQEGKSLSPILLVRDQKNGKVVIADGYHRMCAVYTFDEDAWIPCKII